MKDGRIVTDTNELVWRKATPYEEEAIKYWLKTISKVDIPAVIVGIVIALIVSLPLALYLGSTDSPGMRIVYYLGLPGVAILCALGYCCSPYLSTVPARLAILTGRYQVMDSEVITREPGRVRINRHSYEHITRVVVRYQNDRALSLRAYDGMLDMIAPGVPVLLIKFNNSNGIFGSRYDCICIRYFIRM